MKLSNRVLLCCTFLLLILSCDEEESYPIEPAIEFVSIDFIRTPDVSEADTISLTFSYTDGDADLGFQDETQEFLYYERFYVAKSNGALIPKGKLVKGSVAKEELVRYRDRKKSPYDTLPLYNSASCLNWELLLEEKNNITRVTDTLYFKFNPDIYNIEMDYLVLSGNGVFEEYDFKKGNCSSYDGRFSVPNVINNVDSNPFRYAPINSKKGRITYKMQSTAFLLLFKDKTLKLRFFIKDRALHSSNVVETPEFTLK